MIEFMSLYIDEIWDQRHWELALKSDQPMEAYSKIRSQVKSLRDAVPIEELPPEQQDWLRSS